MVTKEQIEKKNLPAIVLCGQMAFPEVPITLELSNTQTVETCLWANEHNCDLFVTPQSEPYPDNDPTELSNIGTIVSIQRLLRLPDGNIRVFAVGVSRAEALSYTYNGTRLFADLLCREYVVDQTRLGLDERLALFDLVRRFCAHIPKIPKEAVQTVENTERMTLLMDRIADSLLMDFNDKLAVLAECDPVKRYNILCTALASEIVYLQTESEVHKQVRENMEHNQREYYLKEQLKIIQDELGYNEFDDEVEEYIARINDLIDDQKAKEKLIKEAIKLSKIPFGASEGTVIHAYLDTVLEYPWKKFTQDEINLTKARKILDGDHDGIEKVKRRVIEYLAVKKLSGGTSAQILCLVGAPGVGKTSVAQSIAKAMGRKFVRISLGGVRDEAEIRGHRRTYLGAMPGRIIAAITEAGVENPLILLDEIDKMTSDLHGDPSSALLEVLDGEQNKGFRDHFMEIPVDLSRCVFIATANTLDTVQRPLIDRMEIVEMSSYTREEKMAIAKHHLIKKQLVANALMAKQLRISDKVIFKLIDDYTAEAGVRSLERKIAALCRGAAVRLLDGAGTPIRITEKNLREFLPDPVIPSHKVPTQGRVGVVNGMAYTQYGGDLLEVEANSMPGTGKIILTGSLGDVMKESANISVSYIRSISSELKIRESFYRDTDIHVHFPEGAVPKDGPSAGVTVTTAIISELTGCMVRPDVAMTGEISLKGKVLPIGGLREKVMAACQAGVKRILIPKDNVYSMAEVDEKVKREVEFVYCDTIADVLRGCMMFDGIEKATPAMRRSMTALKNFIRG